jgi:SpoVK/Ycf46/Vps4 family AAA+-type ATPase
MAATNNISELPLNSRAGRFDAMFFVDIPGFTERQEIIRIMNTRYASKIPDDFAENIQGWCGAEIERS